MPLEGVDPNLLQDFLTESGELIDALDADLVQLESEPGSIPLLDKIFRALHTIKGAASFLNMPEVTVFAHAAEDALNQLRKGAVAVDATVIDAMLKSVDVLKRMMGEISGGGPISPGPSELVDVLHAIAARATDGAGDHGASSGHPGAAPSRPATPAAPPQDTLTLPPEKLDILPSMIDELDALRAEVTAAVGDLSARGVDPSAGAARVRAAISSTMPTVDFFDFTPLKALLSRGDAVASALAGGQSAPPDAVAHLDGLAAMIADFALGLRAGRERRWSEEAIEQLDPGAVCTAPGQGAHPAENDPAEPAGRASEPSAAAASRATPSAERAQPANAAARGSSRGADAQNRDTEAETTVRVEVSRLEALLNLVGEMVLTKNQILGMTRQLRNHNLPQELMETVGGAAGNLDRLTSELQVGVMRTRLQPLSKLFGRYPRIIRDLARATGKQIAIEIDGGDTEVDKSVLEQLADPMVHILRNSADHGIERPEVRQAAGKDPTGTIRLRAEHQGGHVRVEIADDGKGIDPEVIGRKAIEKGLVTAEQVSAMSSQELVNLVFAPGFSTADQVSDLSGRGVGMDVVRTNIAKIGGTVTVTSEKGTGTRIEVLIPLTVAIMSAMMVGVGAFEYAVPVASIVEIVRLEEGATHSVAGRPVLRLRESVLPLIDLRQRLGEEAGEGRRFAIVVEVGQQRAGLVVDHLVGQQEVVIKPLDDSYTAGGPFSGATIREDGDVSLILDAVQLLRTGASAELAPSAA